MKLKINRSLRKILIIITAVSVCASSILLYRTINNTGFMEEKVPLYNYTNKTDIQYGVILKDNILYSDKNMGEGGTYISEFVDRIGTTFNYQFNGEEAADIKGDYQIVAEVEGYVSENEQSKTIWKKQFVLSPKEEFGTKDKTASISKYVDVNFQEYNTFAQQAINDSKIISSAKLSIIMNINLDVQTEKGNIQESFSPSIVIPLNEGYFEIAKSGVEEKPGAIQEVRNVKAPVNYVTAALYGTVLTVLLFSLLYLIFFTIPKSPVNPLVKSVKKIFKYHGDRLVALDDEITVTNLSISRVKSIDDLVRIADEIGKPIMYKYSTDYKDITKFYVYGDGQIFMFDLKGSRPRHMNSRDKADRTSSRSRLSTIEAR